jgi:hypothetical protein
MHRLRVTPILALAALAAGCAEQPAAPLSFEVPVYVSEHAQDHDFQAHMSGNQEVPPNESRAQGVTVFTLSDDGLSLHYTLKLSAIQNVTQAHIHRAPAGANGPIVLWLYPDQPPAQLIPGGFRGVLRTRTVTRDHLVGQLAGQPLSALIDLIRAGETYVNVHTSQIPAGEVRGQIVE